MSIDEIIADCARTIRELPQMAGTEIVEMKVGDVENAITCAIGQTCRCVCVRFNGFTPRHQGAVTLVGNAAVVAHVYETPAVNTNTGALHLLDMAQMIAGVLHGAKAPGMSTPIYLDRISPIEERVGGVITCAVIFKTVVNL